MTECSQCEYFAKPGQHIPKVHCKRYPPVPVGMIIYNKITNSMESVINMTPAAPYPQGSCGEFKAKLAIR